jgi:adenosine deaminase
VFAQAKALGFKLVAHAGEEGPPEYIWEALQLLKVDRIDHGVRSIEDPELMAYLKQHQVPLTVCPLSNLKLCVIDQMSEHNILQLMNDGLRVTVNADDPSYFGGYLNENFMALAEHVNMQASDLITLVQNGFKASFLPEKTKQDWLGIIEDTVSQLGVK